MIECAAVKSGVFYLVDEIFRQIRVLLRALILNDFFFSSRACEHYFYLKTKPAFGV